MSRFDINGKVAVVSGAAGGIGSALVQELLNQGARKIYCLDLFPNGVPDDGDDRLVPLKFDLTDRAAMPGILDACKDASILVNAAGCCFWQGFADGFDYDDARKEMDLNFWGPVAITDYLLPSLKANAPGGIVNIASFAALVSLPMVGSYSATKSALRSYTECLGFELKPAGIHVMGVYPGPVDTAMNRYSKDGNPASPNVVAKKILDDLEEGQEYSFPDAWSAEWAEKYWASPAQATKELQGNTATVN